MVKSLPERDITNVLLLSVEKPVCQAVALAQMDALNEYLFGVYSCRRCLFKTNEVYQ